jgi:AraC-like DNA-binding protein
MFKKYFYLIILLSFALPSESQVEITIRTLDLADSTDTQVYLYGSFNNWLPRDTNYLLKADNQYPTIHKITLPSSLILPIEFKFNRGSTFKAESNSIGEPIYARKISEPGSYSYTIPNWEDKPETKKKYTAKLRVRKIPDDLPKDLNIYAVGNFNNWNERDTTFKLERTETDLWQVDIPFSRDTLEYKYHRGNWIMVEAKPNGRAKANRKIITNTWTDTYVNMDIIDSWEDIHGGLATPYTLLLIIAAIFAIIVGVILFIKSGRSNKASGLMAFWLLILGVEIFARAIVFNRVAFQAMPKLFVVPGQLMYYCIPIYILFTKSFLELKLNWKPYVQYLLFIPGISYSLFLLISYYPMGKEEFILYIQDFKFEIIQTISTIAGFVFNAFMFYVIGTISGKRSLLKDKELIRQKKGIINVLLVFLLIAIALWGTTILLGLYFERLDALEQYRFVLHFLSDSMWFIIAFGGLIIGIMTLSLPKVFSAVELNTAAKQIQIDEPSVSPLKVKNKGQLEHILKYMDESRPYLDSKLTLTSLAIQLDMSSHNLSKIINEEFNKNFNDFVNGYRIKEFKKIILEGEHPNLTLLSYGYMVGFNSKTSFNRSFKRITGQTPSDFFNKIQLN